MSHREWTESPFPSEQTHPLLGTQKIITTCILLLIAYYGIPYLTYETTLKRSLYEATLNLIPFSFIQAMQSLILRPNSLTVPLAHRRDRSDSKAKSEALQQIYEGSGLPGVVKRARGWSGYDKLVSPTADLLFPGLNNWDNSCFQNSVLQGLSSLPAFVTYLQRSLQLCTKAGTEANTHRALSDLSGQLNEGIHKRTSMWPPEVLKSLDTWQQQDAQEYFSKIQDELDKEASRCRKTLVKRSHPGLNCLDFDRNPDAALKKAALQRIEHVVSKVSPANPLDGMLAQNLRCQKCGFTEGFTFMPFNCLTLNLGLGGGNDVESLLDVYTEPELIEGIECDGCTRKAAEADGDEYVSSGDERSSPNQLERRQKKTPKVRSTKEKQITFGRLPKDLVLHINRSIFDDYGNQHKNFAPINFPPRLEIMGEWCAPINGYSEGIQAVYELKCIVTHSGRHDNGHYIACGKRGKDWYSFNDEMVTKITEENVLGRGNVFMLFYEKVEGLLDFDHPQGTHTAIPVDIASLTVEDKSPNGTLHEPKVQHDSPVV